jgi:hypothetical protein
MTKKDDDVEKELAALREEVAALKAKVSPPKSDFKPMTDADAIASGFIWSSHSGQQQPWPSWQQHFGLV